MAEVNESRGTPPDALREALARASTEFRHAIEELEELIAHDSTIQAQLALDSVMIGLMRLNDARAALSLPRAALRPAATEGERNENSADASKTNAGADANG